MLKISDTLSLPDSYVTSTGALLAVRGAGKSNTAAVIAEEMFRHHLPFVVVDPVGAWWGLRSSGDGTGPGLAVPIFGGSRGDLPLERGAGELVADLVVDQRLSCVLDLSRFNSEGDKKTFLLAFARRLYQRNEDPLHLFLEEADDYIPQRPMRDEAQLLRAFENIVRRGRGRGIGITLITQRSAAIAKMVLTQTETLFAMRTTGPQDIKAIEAWVQYHQADRDILASLSGLEDGEAWVWSPHFLKRVERVTIRRRWTYDSGATPSNVKAGQARKAATLADIDLEQLRGRMTETVERAKAEDPKELRKQIADLRRQLSAAPAITAPSVRVEVPVLTPGAREAISALVASLSSLGPAITSQAQAILVALARTDNTKIGHGREAALSTPHRTRTTGSREPSGVQGPAGSNVLDGAQQKILDVVAMLGVRGLTPNREMVARWLGIHPNGGRYNSNLAALREQGYLSERGFVLSQSATVTVLETGIDGALAVLDGSQGDMVKVLNLNGRPLTRETLAAQLQLHPNGGRYNTNLARLRTMGLIPTRGDMTLTEAAYR